MLSWSGIDDVLLDMDGTLLDLRFDAEFWLEHLPRHYAEANAMPHDQALARIRARMESLSGQIGWYCIDEWSAALGLDIGALKLAYADGICYRDTAVPFLEALATAGKRALIVTNAHPQTIDIKLHRTGLDQYVETVVSSHRYRAAKEEQGFWRQLHDDHVFDKARTLFIDDNLAVLRSARRFGIGQLLAVSHPDSGREAKDTGEFEAIQWFTEIMPIE